MAVHTIINLSDHAGTSITVNPPTTFEEVAEEFHKAWTEQRLMMVYMEREGYIHRVNPQQVVLLQQLDY
jgi:hypothetical protein